MPRSQSISPKILAAIEKAIGGLEQFSKNCHACSLAIVRTKLLPATARVARGFHSTITSQHSWVVIGDPYDYKSLILDGTLWSYTGRQPVIFCGKSRDYHPHGKGRIWDVGFPPRPTADIIPLGTELSNEGKIFMSIAAPDGLDMRGWHSLANSPVLGWPAKEILTAMYNNPDLKALIPVDIVGMVTDQNPGGLYW